jgi:hypothetical protein
LQRRREWRSGGKWREWREAEGSGGVEESGGKRKGVEGSRGVQEKSETETSERLTVVAACPIELKYKRKTCVTVKFKI